VVTRPERMEVVMANSPDVGALVTSITSDVKLIVGNEIALLKAELKPTMAKAGIGSGLFAVAACFAITVLMMLWILGAVGFSWMYASVTSWSGWACGFTGTATMMVVLLVLAAVCVIVGKNRFSKIRGPQKTPETIQQTVEALKLGITQGKDLVDREFSKPED